MSIDDITWGDIDRANQAAACYETATCPHCGRLMIRRLPEHVLGGAEGIHRHPNDARAGRHPPPNCPDWRQPLHRRNLTN